VGADARTAFRLSAVKRYYTEKGVATLHPEGESVLWKWHTNLDFPINWTKTGIFGMRRFFLICAVLLAGGAVAFGYTNVLENGTNQTVTTVWDAGGDMTIGGITSNNTLTIVSGGSLTNINAYVGAQAGASNNMATVSGAGAEWINTGTLQVGASGNSNNTVSVSSGGTVTASNLVVFADNAFNLNTNGNLEIGGAFDAGQDGFNWNDGGHLSVGGRLWGLPVTNLNHADSTIFDGENKKLTLTGESAWWNHGGNNLITGLEGSRNQLIVTNGGTVINSDAYVGYSDTASSNSVLVTGSNSHWGVNGTLTVGSTNNAGNSVTVTDGSKISVTGLMVNSNNTFNLNAEGHLEIDGDFNAGQGGFNWAADGLLSVGEDLAGLDGLYGTNQLLTIDGGSWLHGTNDLVIGLNGYGNSLTIQNGGAVSNAAGYVGLNAGADSNLVTVTGGDSIWANTGTLQVGAADTNGISINRGNNVTATNFGRVSVGGLVVADGNEFNLDKDGTLVVTGSFNAGQGGFNWGDGGSLMVQSNLAGLLSMDGADQKLILDGGYMTNSLKAFSVGWDYSNNCVAATNGALVEMDNVYLGHNLGSDGNTLSVSGSHSVVHIKNVLMVGRGGEQNRMEIGSMGHVTNEVAYVGYGRDSSNNLVAVSGEGAEWINGTLNVGWYTNSVSPQGTTNWFVNSGNSVTVANGGLVQADILVIQDGNDFNLVDGGTLRMTGNFTNSAEEVKNLDWQKGGNLSVGGALSGITNVTGGRILTLDGTSAMWDLIGTNILVGGDGESGSTLVSTNGAIVKTDNLHVEGSENTVNVAANAWLLVGDGATTNTLAIGGVMVASTNGAEVGVENFGQLNIAETLQVGLSTNETGTVTVADNGIITAGNLVIADTNSAFNLNADGTLRMTGDFDTDQGGFNWNEGGHLSIGGDVQNLTGLLETNQLLTIGGTNATWMLGSADLVIGQDGNDNQLFIEDGGFVSNLNATVGASSNAWDNAVMVSGSNSVWNNTGTLQIGAVETNGASLNSGNSVTVSDNGTVITDDLVIYTNNYFNLDDGGTLRMTGAFNLSDYINTNFTTLNWKSGGTLALEGALTGMATTNLVVEGSTNAYTYLEGGHIVAIGGASASWANGGDTNLIVGLNSSNNGLIITNGGTVDNASGYVGWGSDAKDNLVLVSGAGSTWTNRGNLYVGGYAGSNDWYNAGANNSLTVESNGWVFVGDAATNLSSGYVGGIGVASTNGAELIVGNGAITAEQGLHIGVDAGMTGSVTIRDKGTAILSELNIETNSEFNLYGTLKMTGDFDVSQYINSSFTNLNWNDGGNLVMLDSDLSGISSLSGSNKTITIEGGSWSNETQLLSIDGVGNKLVVSSNSLVTSAGASIGTTTNDLNNSVVVSGSNSVWQNSVDLYVGDAGSGNSLLIEDGGFVTNVNAYVGDASTASNNTVRVAGSNSVWGIAGNLYVGNTGSNSTLTVSGNGTVRVGNDLHIRNNSTLDVGSTNIFVGGDMTIADSVVDGDGTIHFGNGNSILTVTGTNSTLSVDVLFDGGGGTNDIKFINSLFSFSGSLTNRFVGFNSLLLQESTLEAAGAIDGIPTITLDGGVLELTGDLKIDGELTALNQPLLKLTAGEQVLELSNTNFNLSTLDAEIRVNDNLPDPRNFKEVILLAENGLTPNMFGDARFDEHYLLYSFDFVYTNDQVSVESTATLDGEIGSALAYSGIQGIRAGFNGMQNAAFVRTKQLRRNTVATDHAISHEAYLMSAEGDEPVGPKGPGDKNTIFGMHFWAEQFSGQGDYNAMGLSDGFTLNNNGTTFGLDRLFGDSLVAGINYTYARSAARVTGGDRVDTETYWLGLYSEWFGKNDYYLEGLIGLGWSDYDTVRADVGYEGVGTFEGTDLGGHIEAGKYFHRNNWAMAPYAGLHYLGIKSDTYTETEQASGAEIVVNGQSVASLESALGMKLRNRFDTQAGRFQTVGYAEWTYDFINDDIGSTLSDGTISVGTARIAPGASLINAGVGFSWICTDYLEIGIGYDGRFNEDYKEHMGSVMLDVRF